MPWLIAGAVVAVYAAAGFLLVPTVLRGLATDYVHETWGRELVLGDIRFNPFSLTLEVTGLELPDAAPEPRPVVAFERLRLNAGLASAWRRAVSFQDIEVEGLAISAIVRPGGALNLQDLVPPEEPGAPVEEEEELTPVVIDTLHLARGQVHYEDRSLPQPYVADVAPLDFTLSDFSTRVGMDNAYHFDATAFDTTRLAWRGTISAEPLASDGELTITGLPLPRLAGYLDALAPVVIGAGTATLRGSYRYAAGPGEGQLTFRDGALELSGLQVGTATEADMLVLPAVALTGLSADLWARRARVERLDVKGGDVRFVMDPEGNINLATLVAEEPAAAPASTSASAPTAAPTSGDDEDWDVQIPVIALQDLTVAVEDRSVTPAAAFRLSPVALGLRDYATTPGSVAGLTLTAVIGDDGRLTTIGTINLDTLAASARVTLDGLDLTAFQPYLASSTGLTLKSGKLRAAGDLKYREEGDEGLTDFKGDVTLSGFRTVDDSLREDFVKWDELDVRDLDYQAKPERLRIREVAARSPYARIIIGPDGTTNLATALNPPGTVIPAAAAPVAEDSGKKNAKKQGGKKQGGKPAPGAAPAPAEPVTPFPVSIRSVRIRNGSTNFADFSTTPRFATGIQKLDGTITGLSSNPKARARVDLKGQVDEYSPVTIRGEANPLSAESWLDLALNFRNVELADFTPYAGRFAGYTIRRGKMSAELNYKVVDRKLDARHEFVIEQLELGDKVDSPEAGSLPLKLAVSLLKDRNGVIDLDLPVTGDLDDPRFRVGPIVWKMFVNLITKAVTAPFALLGNLVGGGEELNRLDFAPGVAAPGAAQQAQLADLVKAMTERPGVAINVPAVYGVKLDRPALVDQELERRLMARAGRTRGGAPADFAALSADRDRYLDLLKAEFRSVAPKEPFPEPPAAAEGEAEDEPLIGLLEQGLRARLDVPDTALRELANARASAVQKALLDGTGVDPGRVFLTAPDAAPEEGGVVVMELSLR